MQDPPPTLCEITAALDAPAAAVVRAAFDWAEGLHGAQRRKDGTTVFDHVARVAGHLPRFAPGAADLVVAGLLHDAVESGATDLPTVERRFGRGVARLVDAVTNRPGDDAGISAERAERAGRDAVLLRLCDRLDGVRHSRGRPADQREAFLATTRETYLPLAERHFPAVACSLREALAAAERP